MKISWKSPFRLATESLRAGFAKLLGAEVVVKPDVFDSRIQKCYVCPHFSDGQCGKCTCFMEIKAWIGTSGCIDRRWSATITIRSLLKAKFTRKPSL